MRGRERKIIGLVFLLIAFDRILKLWALHGGIAIINKGIGFGILLSCLPREASAKWGYLAILLLGLSFYLIFHFLKRRSVGVLLVLAGGISNLLDRLFYGGVVDFITLSFMPIFIRNQALLIFNMADILVVAGFVLIFIDLLKNHKL